MIRVAIYGKGGIGKSTVCTHLSALFASEGGKKVIHVGCDPKHDSTMRLALGEVTPPTVIGLLQKNANALRPSQFVVEGRFGVDLVECGGPEPGAGCGGRGVARMFEMFEKLRLLERGDWEVALFDVLGDVVCGGFAAPMRQGFAERAFIVTSEELMSLYAANNVAKAIQSHAGNGVALGGVIANLRDNAGGELVIESFAEQIGTRVVAVIPRDQVVLEAEERMMTVLEHRPEARVLDRYRALVRAIEEFDPAAAKVPAPMDERAFNVWVASAMRRAAVATA
ncbi:MAG: AAA family ATPase [Sandaracinaceae bacterium]|nr:AAA family ATPase [Sandaracinaceae bacterium]